MNTFKLAHADLEWKTAFLEAQVNSSIDGILVVDQQGKKILQNRQFTTLLKIPNHLADDVDDQKQLNWVLDTIKDADRFLEKVTYLYLHEAEISRDDIELKDGTMLDRYSAPVVGENGKCYGRIWTFRDVTEQRRTEKELKQAKIDGVLREGAERYTFLADTIPLILWTARPDGGLDYYNKAWFDYTGLTLAQTKDWGWAAVVHPDDLQPCIECWTRSFTTGKNYEIEYRFKRGSDEKYRWFLGRASARRNEAGEIVQWVGTCTDIEDQKRAHSELEGKIAERTAELATSNAALRMENAERESAETAIRFNEQRYRTLVEATTAIVWDTPASGEFTAVQPSWSAFTGQSFEELRGWGWLQAVHPDDRAETTRVWTAAVASRAIYEVEHRLQARDKTYRIMMVRAVPILAEDGAMIRQWVGVHIDITELKQAEESLRLLGSAVEQTKESIMITNAELDLPGPAIVFVNHAFTKMTGYNEADVLGKTPRILQGPRTERAVLDRLRENLEQGKVFEGETINYRKDGSAFDHEWQIAPLRNASGKITHFVAIQHDITNRKQLEAKLFQSQKMETVGKLAGGVAHEFNSILTAIIGQSELLLGDLPAGSPLGKNVTEITKAANRAAILTRQLLAYGRKQTLQPEILDLNAMLAGMDSTLRHLVGRNTDVRVAPAGGLAAVKADAGQMEQVILNIVINAGEAMPNGGKLTLETAHVTFDDQRVGRYSELKPGDYVMLAITDTGTGMSEAVKARVFEPFYTTKDVGEGTGLGLSTCYGIIKQSGGHISVYSEPGRGTTFKIYLPQVETRASAPIRRMDSPDLPRGTETIVLAEDDPALREMAAILLRRLGYTVWTATNGDEALSLKHQRGIGQVDLWFTDVVMPHMSGKELAYRVQALYPHTKILFTSAYTENAIVHQGVLNPGVALLQKPFTPAALANKVREVLDGPGDPKPDQAPGI